MTVTSLAEGRPAFARARRRRRVPTAWIPYLFLAPALIWYAAFLVYPMLQSLYISFFDWDGLSPTMTFVGLKNYIDIFMSDEVARLALWQAGLDYDHGTGHGVGVFLQVHEGPARISKAGTVPLEPGMILSNEPGYYKTGAFGIRIENLVIVEPPSEISGGDRPMLSFETLTLAPIDRSLIEPALMTADEIAWLDAYHARVRAALQPSLQGEAETFLLAATQPLVA